MKKIVVFVLIGFLLLILIFWRDLGIKEKPIHLAHKKTEKEVNHIQFPLIDRESELKYKDYISGLHHYEAIETNRDDFPYLIKSPIGMKIDTGNLQWVPSKANEGKSYRVTVGILPKRKKIQNKEFVIKVAVTKSLHTNIDHKTIEINDSNCRLLGGRFKIKVETLDFDDKKWTLALLDLLDVRQVTSKVEFHVPKGISKLSCFFVVGNNLSDISPYVTNPPLIKLRFQEIDNKSSFNLSNKFKLYKFTNMPNGEHMPDAPHGFSWASEERIRSYGRGGGLYFVGVRQSDR